jgi:hypothetical protein
MQSETLDPRASWHADLADKDRDAHADMARVARDSEIDQLQRRLDALAAELDMCRAAVHRRSELLAEQAIALAERDRHITRLEDAAAALVAAAPAPSPLRRAVRAVRARLPHP